MPKQKKSKATTTACPALAHFKFVHPTAQRVCIAGRFNDGHCSTTPMVLLGEGRWAKELLLPPGTYEYGLDVDDEWVGDPQAYETVANPFGSHNVLLRVQPPDGTKTAGISHK
jgi:1,4-alpha-glucan branching enzyme